MNKLKKTLLVICTTIVIAVIIIFVFTSSIAKYLVEKYDEKYTGRQITMDWAYVNLFTGFIHFNNLKIYEYKSDSVFFSAADVKANFAMLKMFSKTYEISEFTLHKPQGFVIQNKKKFNFSDLIEKFSSKENQGADKSPVHFNILNIKINDGEFHYQDEIIPINYFIKNVNLESNGVLWNVDSIATKFSFLSGIGNGSMKGNFTINVKNKDYNLGVVVREFDMNIIEQYLKNIANYGTFSANLDADIKTSGNFIETENTTTKGVLAINNFHFGKNKNEDYVSFDKLAISMKELSPKKHIYFYDSIALSRPYFKYELYDLLDNVQTMFGKNGSKIKAVENDAEQFNLIIEIAKYIEILSKNFFESDYKINRLAVYNGDIKFNDYSKSEKFSIELNPLYILADSIDKNNKWVKVSLKSAIKPYGNVDVKLKINPKNSKDFDLHYQLQKLPLALFNPYTISFTSFPLDRGTLEFNGDWNVRDAIIKSNNHIVVIDPRLANRVKNKNNKWIPMQLIIPFVRERGNVIDYEIPINGNLKNPKFVLKDVIFDVFENIFVKPITTPYRIKVKTAETEIEKSHSLKWEMRTDLLNKSQENFLKKLAKFLEKNPNTFITITPHQYTIKENEYILFFEAKKKYFVAKNLKNTKAFSKEDSIKVNKMSIKDSLFVKYLDGKINSTMVFTIQDKCLLFVGKEHVNFKLHQLNAARKKVFVSYFKEKEVESQLKIKSIESIIPYNGFSFYKIEYKGEIPSALESAYNRMNDLNNEEPRNKFKKDRKKTEKIF